MITKGDTEDPGRLEARRATQDRRIAGAANALTILPLVVVGIAAVFIVTNRYEKPSDAPDVGQGVGILVGVVLMLTVTVGLVACSLLHTSPGAVVLRRRARDRRQAMGGLVLMNVVVGVGALAAYQILSIDYPSPPTLPQEDLKREIAEAVFDPTNLPESVELQGIRGPGGLYPYTNTADGSPWFAFTARDGQRTGAIIYWVKASPGDAKSISSKWVSEGSFGGRAFDYPSNCLWLASHAIHACTVRMGQTLVEVRIQGTWAEDRAAEALAIDLTRAAIKHLEAVIATAHTASPVR